MFTRLALMSAFALSASAFAGDHMDWKACAKETAEFKCKGDDHAIWECLKAHDAALSKECQATQATQEKAPAKSKK